MPAVPFWLSPLAVTWFEDLGRPACRLLVVFVVVFITSNFSRMRLLASNSDMGLFLVWTLLVDLFSLVDHTRGMNTPASIALGVIGMHKPLSHAKATVPESGLPNMKLRYFYLRKI